MSFLRSIFLKLATGAMFIFFFFVYLGNVGGIAENKALEPYIFTAMWLIMIVLGFLIIKLRLSSGPYASYFKPKFSAFEQIPKIYKVAALMVLTIVIFILMRRSAIRTG